MVSMAAVLERMRAEVQSRERELERVKAALRAIENFVGSLTPEELRVFEQTIEESQVKTLFGHPDAAQPIEVRPHTRQRGSIPPSEIAASVRNILLNAKRPMRRGELVAQLEQIGVPLSGKDKNKNLGTILWRHKHEFIQLDNLGYWLRNEPLEGIYTPQE